MFVEVPVKIHNSSLAQALVADLDPAPRITAPDLERLDLGSAAYLTKTMSQLIEGIDDVLAEAQKVSLYHRNLARQQQHMAQWLAKRRQENAARRAAGEGGRGCLGAPGGLELGGAWSRGGEGWE